MNSSVPLSPAVTQSSTTATISSLSPQASLANSSLVNPSLTNLASVNSNGTACSVSANVVQPARQILNRDSSVVQVNL